MLRHSLLPRTGRGGPRGPPPAPEEMCWRKESELNAQGLRSPRFELGAVAASACPSNVEEDRGIAPLRRYDGGG